MVMVHCQMSSQVKLVFYWEGWGGLGGNQYKSGRNLLRRCIKQIMNVFSFVQWKEYFYEVKDENVPFNEAEQMGAVRAKTPLSTAPVGGFCRGNGAGWGNARLSIYVPSSY